MTPILADISGGELLMTLATVGLFIIALVALFKRSDTHITNKKISVEMSEELHNQFAAKVDFKQHRDEIWKTLRDENRRLDDRIQGTREAVAALQQATDNQNQSLARIEGKVDSAIREIKKIS